MTNTYLTGAPLGSTAPKDLYDNASNFDEAMNSTSPSFKDRFGLRRETWAGMQKMVADYLEAMGFEAAHLTYVDGQPLTVNRPTQLIGRAGITYKVTQPANFPVTLTGTWATDALLLTDVSQTDLRNDLATVGNSIIKGSQQTLNTIFEMASLSKTAPSKFAEVLGYYAPRDGGGGLYYLDGADTTSPGNGGSIIVATDGGRWKLVDKINVRPEQFGAKGDWDGSTGTDDWAAFNNLNSHLAANSGCHVTVSKRHLVGGGWENTASNLTVTGLRGNEIYTTSPNKDGFHAHSVNNLTVLGLKCTLRTDLFRSAGFGIFIEESNDIRIEDCITYGGTAGIWHLHCNRVMVRGCNVSNTKADGIHFGQGSTFCKAHFNTVRNVADDALACTFYTGFGRGSDIEFVGNTVKDSIWGFGVAVYGCDRVLVEGNNISGVALGGCIVTEHDGSGGSSNVLVTGNNISSSNWATVVPNNFWFGTPDEAIVSPLHKSCIMISGQDVVAVGNKIANVQAATGTDQRTGIYINGGLRVSANDNSLLNVYGQGVIIGPASIAQFSVNGNSMESVLGVGIWSDSSTFVTSGSICNNTFGYGSTLGSPYMIQVNNYNTTRIAICNNTSSNGRGVSLGGANPNIMNLNNNA